MQDKTITRVKRELNALGNKILKLYDFVLSENFSKLDEAPQGLLIVQGSIMQAYKIILDARLSL